MVDQFFFEVLIHENHRNICDPLETEHLWLSFFVLKKIRIKQENTGTLMEIGRLRSDTIPGPVISQKCRELFNCQTAIHLL